MLNYIITLYIILCILYYIYIIVLYSHAASSMSSLDGRLPGALFPFYLLSSDLMFPGYSHAHDYSVLFCCSVLQILSVFLSIWSGTIEQTSGKDASSVDFSTYKLSPTGQLHTGLLLYPTAISFTPKVGVIRGVRGFFVDTVV